MITTKINTFHFSVESSPGLKNIFFLRHKQRGVTVYLVWGRHVAEYGGHRRRLFEPGAGRFGHLLHLHTGRVAQLTIFHFALILHYQTWTGKGNQKIVFLYLVPEPNFLLLWRACHTLDSDCYLLFFCTFVSTFGGDG